MILQTGPRLKTVQFSRTGGQELAPQFRSGSGQDYMRRKRKVRLADTVWVTTTGEGCLSDGRVEESVLVGENQRVGERWWEGERGFSGRRAPAWSAATHQQYAPLDSIAMHHASKHCVAPHPTHSNLLQNSLHAWRHT